MNPFKSFSSRLAFAAGMALFCAGQAKAQLPAYVPANGLIGYWQFDGNLQNSASGQYSATGTQYSYTADRANTTAHAIDFNGSANYALINDLPVNLHGPYTLNFWVYLKTYNSSDVISDFHPTDECGNYPQIWEYYDSINIARCSVVNTQVSLGHRSVFEGHWKMLTQVIGTDTTSVFLDGQLVKKFRYSWDPSTLSNLILANGYNWHSNYITPAKVKLDDAGLWNRALTACEITQLYQSSVLAITTQPADQSKATGTAATFTIVTNIPAPAYQWQVKAASAGSFTNIANGGQYSGATSSTLTVSGLLATNNGQEYRCVVTGNSGCNATSNAAKLSITQVGITLVNAQSEDYLMQNTSDPSGSTSTIGYQVNRLEQSASILVYDLSGRIVRTIAISQPGRGEATLNTAGWTNGLYLYTLVVDGRRIATRKMALSR